jgi:MFS family permease
MSNQVQSYDIPGVAGAGHRTQMQKATASGWIGSALEFYDFFIYAQAATLIFPQLFFSTKDTRVAIIASLAIYGVGYIARPIGSLFFGHVGDTRGRRAVLVLCMYLMGCSTMAIGLLPTYRQVGMLAPLLLVILRLIQGFAVAGEISGASSMILEHAPFGQRGYYTSFTLQGVQAGQILAAGVFIPLAYYMPDDAFNAWGWRIPFLLSAGLLIAGYIVRRKITEPPVFTVFIQESQHGSSRKAPIIEAFRVAWKDMLRVVCMSLMNVIPMVTTVFGAAYAVQASYGIGFHKLAYLWLTVLCNGIAVLVIPFVGRWSDKIGRRPPIIVAALLTGLLSFGYLYSISIANLSLAMLMSLLMWGCVYQGYNAIFPSFYPELFPTRIRVSAMAIAQNIGTTLTALLPALFAAVAPPGSSHIPLTIGTITFGLTMVAAVAAWSARETCHTRLSELG